MMFDIITIFLVGILLLVAVYTAIQFRGKFPKRTIERLEKDALERYRLEEMVTNPDLLRKAQPSQTLLKAVLHTKHLMNQEVLALAITNEE